MSFLYWDPNPNLFTLPIVHWPVPWYSALFALGFVIGFPLFRSVLLRVFVGTSKAPLSELKKQALLITDRITIYMVLGAALGARIGHFLFYENPRAYLSNLKEIFAFPWQGLSSHGAALGIVIALLLFCWRYQKKIQEKISLLLFLDLVSIPTALAGALIRLGNFVNQEILGTKTTLPWGVVFGHPADHSLPEPRHPVQIYESLAYLGIFFLLWALSFKKNWLFARGKIFGLFLVLVFGFRLGIECLKEEQSHWISSWWTWWTMGQLLSVPLILVGLFFLTRFNKRADN